MKQILFKIIYFLGNLLFYRKRNIPKDNITSILVISLYFRGDALFHTPVIKFLKDTFPKAAIDVWTKKRNEDIFKGNPAVNEVIIFDEVRTADYNENVRLSLRKKLKFITLLRKKKYDLVIDLTGKYSTAIISYLSKGKNTIGINYNGFGFLYNRFYSPSTYNTEGHLIDKYLEAVKYGLGLSDKKNNETAKPQFYIDTNAELLVDKWLKQNINESSPFITIHTTAGWDAKHLPVKTFSEAAEKLLTGTENSIVLVGTEFDKGTIKKVYKNIPEDIKSRVHIFMSGSLDETARLIERSSLFIGADSVPLHLADTLGTPSIGLFGPTNPEFSRPRIKNSVILYHKLACSAGDDHQYCTRNGGRTCPLYECMNSITSDEIAAHAAAIIKKHS